MDEAEWRRREIKQYKKLLAVNPDRTDQQLRDLLAVDQSELEEIRAGANE